MGKEISKLDTLFIGEFLWADLSFRFGRRIFGFCGIQRLPQLLAKCIVNIVIVPVVLPHFRVFRVFLGKVPI